MHKIIRLPIIILFFGIAFYSVYAFASSETNRMQTGGEGASPISGWTVSNVGYQLGQDPSKIAAVEFNLDRSAGAVQISLNSSTAEFFPCENLSGAHWFCEIGSQVSLVSADELRVIATGN